MGPSLSHVSNVMETEGSSLPKVKWVGSRTVAGCKSVWHQAMVLTAALSHLSSPRHLHQVRAWHLWGKAGMPGHGKLVSHRLLHL